MQVECDVPEVPDEDKEVPDEDKEVPDEDEEVPDEDEDEHIERDITTTTAAAIDDDVAGAGVCELLEQTVSSVMYICVMFIYLHSCMHTTQVIHVDVMLVVVCMFVYIIIVITIIANVQ